jgi:hypothetical protein
MYVHVKTTTSTLTKPEYTQNYCFFLGGGLCPSSGILKTREHNVSEYGSLSIFRSWGDTYRSKLILKAFDDGVFIHQWLYSLLLGPGLSLSFVIFFTQSAGHLGRVISPSQGR